VGEVRAEILLRGPGDEALRVNGAGEVGMEVAPFGMRRRKARSAVRSSRAASKMAAAMVVLNSPATTAKRNKTMKAARKMTARTIRRRKACPAALFATRKLAVGSAELNRGTSKQAVRVAGLPQYR
jgi:hypothetical protein